MGVKDYGKLAKLKIISENANDTFVVMFNPESYSETFAVTFETVGDVNSGLEKYRYTKTPPHDFKLKLIIDGTGVTEYGDSFFPIFKRSNQTVSQQINHFLNLAWYPVNGEAIPLQILWGEFSFHCMLKEVTINYTLFDRDGIPLRAELDATFTSDPQKYKSDCEKRLKGQKKEIETANNDTIPAKTTSNGIVITVS